MAATGITTNTSSTIGRAVIMVQADHVVAGDREDVHASDKADTVARVGQRLDVGAAEKRLVGGRTLIHLRWKARS